MQCAPSSLNAWLGACSHYKLLVRIKCYTSHSWGGCPTHRVTNRYVELCKTEKFSSERRRANSSVQRDAPGKSGLLGASSHGIQCLSVDGEVAAFEVDWLPRAENDRDRHLSLHSGNWGSLVISAGVARSDSFSYSSVAAAGRPIVGVMASSGDIGFTPSGFVDDLAAGLAGSIGVPTGYTENAIAFLQITYYVNWGVVNCSCFWGNGVISKRLHRHNARFLKKRYKERALRQARL